MFYASIWSHLSFDKKIYLPSKRRKILLGQVDVCTHGHKGETLQFPITTLHPLDIWMEQYVQRPTKFFIICRKEKLHLGYFNNDTCMKSFEKTLWRLL